MKTKCCTACGLVKPITEFYPTRLRKDGTMAYRADCKDCSKIRSRKWDLEHPDKRKRTAIEYYRKTRLEALLHYSEGSLKCACCGEEHIEFLAIDHINGDGSKHRREIRLARGICQWLKNQGYPDGFQVLCMNCNFAKGSNKVCPHELERLGEYKSIDIQATLSPPRPYTSRNRLITYQGETLSLSDWAKKLKLSRRVLSTRINNHGWDIERAFTQPVRATRTIRMITYEGRTQCLREWSKETGISHDAIAARLDRYGWTVHDALTKPSKRKTK